jgi:hypothetical protein
MNENEDIRIMTLCDLLSRLADASRTKDVFDITDKIAKKKGL